MIASIAGIIAATMIGGGLGAWWYALGAYSFGEAFLTAAYGAPRLPAAVQEKGAANEIKGVASSMVAWLLLFVAIQQLAALWLQDQTLPTKVLACTVMVAVGQGNWHCHAFFESRPQALFFIHAGYHIAGTALGCFVLFLVETALQ